MTLNVNNMHLIHLENETSANILLSAVGSATLINIYFPNYQTAFI